MAPPEHGQCNPMKHPFLIGERVYLRAVSEEDLRGNYFQWLNDYQATKYTESGRTPNTKEAMENYFHQVIRNTKNVALAVVDKETDQHIGNVKLGPINWVHRCAEFGILVGEKEYWGKGFGTEATLLLLGYAFQRLNLHKVVLGVCADHAGAIRAYERVGFREEGRLREALFIDGIYRDKVIMGVTALEFREKHAGAARP